jgi:hypothetical protein
MSAPKLGSGARFRKLSATLAARGASDPDALAAFIGRKKFGGKGMGRLSQGKSLANDAGLYLFADGPEPYQRDPDENVQCPNCDKYNDSDARYCDQCGQKLPPSAFADLSNPVHLAEDAKDDQGMTLTCPECDYSGPADSFGADGASLQTSPSDLRTPAPGTGAVRDGVPLTVKGGAAHALAGGTRSAVELAAGTVRRPIQGPMDVLVKRGSAGTAVLHHRIGGAQIATLRKDGGKWVASVNGRDLQPRDHQRTALMEAVGTWNGALRGAVRPQAAPLQQEPQQTPLMAEYGIPAMRSAAFATPTVGASDGPRMTTAGGSGDSDGDDGTDENGLTPKGQAIYKKLIAKGFPAARALAFAKNSQKTKPGAFGKSAG